MEPSDLAVLSCGNYQRHMEFFENLSNNITKIENKIIALPNESNENITLLGPFYGRTLLENVATAIIGRIDPFRLLFLRNVQLQDTFGLGSRSNSAIKWSEDIFEQGLSANDRVPHKMWSSEKRFKDIPRGLFGDYYGDIFWKQAYQSLLDETADDQEDFIEGYRRQTAPEGFVIRIRQSASRLYSSLSKGVHSELVIKSEIIYDRTTVLDLISDTLELCGIISLVSHKINTTICQLELNEAINRFVLVNKRSDNYGH